MALQAHQPACHGPPGTHNARSALAALVSEPHRTTGQPAVVSHRGASAGPAALSRAAVPAARRTRTATSPARPPPDRPARTASPTGPQALAAALEVAVSTAAVAAPPHQTIGACREVAPAAVARTSSPLPSAVSRATPACAPVTDLSSSLSRPLPRSRPSLSQPFPGSRAEQLRTRSH